MNILLLSDKPLTRQRGDGIRVHALLAALHGRHHFHLLSFDRKGMPEDAELDAMFASITRVPAPLVPPVSGAIARWTGAFALKRFKLNSPAMRAALQAALDSGRFHALVDISGNMLLNLPPGPLPVPLIVDSVDEPLLRDIRAWKHAPLRERPMLARQIAMFWRYERKLLARAQRNLYVSEDDVRVYLQFFPGRPAQCIPNGVDSEYYAPRPGAAVAGLIALEGNMSFGPNIDAAETLVRDILPRVRRTAPQARVRLIGRDPVHQVQTLASAAVEVTGTVPDVRPYLAEAAVFACPMRLGSGIKTKILQAWAMGVPVVATPQSLGGLQARQGENLLVADSPDEFATAVSSLLRDPARAAAVGAAGRRTVEAAYGWHTVARQYESMLEDALAEWHGKRRVQDSLAAVEGHRLERVS